MPRPAVIALIALILCVLYALECMREPFGTLAEDVCSAVNKDSAAYAAHGLDVTCAKAGDINPGKICTVGCDVDTLCRNLSILYCVKAAQHDKATCDVRGEHYGSHPDSNYLPNIYRVRRGTCLTSTDVGRMVDDRHLRACLMRFPSELAVVAEELAGTSRFRAKWTVSLDGKTPVELPLQIDEFLKLCAARTRSESPDVPVMAVYESSRTPSGTDTSYSIHDAMLTQKVKTVRYHKNQPDRLHVTVMFTLPTVTSANLGGLTYTAVIPGATQTSPVSGKAICARTTVWLCMRLNPKAGKMDDVREIMMCSGGETHVHRSTEETAFDMDNPLKITGPHELWLGLRDGAADCGY